MLKNKNYYNLVKKQLEKDKILENFEKINGKITNVMEIDVISLPKNLNIDQKEDHENGIYAFGASFLNKEYEVGILMDINELKPLSPFWLEKEKKNINKKDMKFFLESLGEYLEEGKTNFPIFVFYNNKNKLSISPQAIDPLDILKK
ncbi:MAG: hypothetical protein E7I76_00155 [Anaerococcus vaginalis]|uniref:hypothetical protein n=1 Tax=Anaerococcus vaginalis TaxID=33037 RepID=UPI002912883C|nr:hypothetical protein [Anaerococcus vaginalis]MDU4446401.1 hypothetical protein [Anaerococcus vaginalis]MDU6181302.1 hypothetical protein [Anaerococcus vaginalis]MDU7431924.1 hypothetical protein [Anaerococcus vaginalis]